MSESVSIYKLGIYGKAYDVPGTRRAYTYKHQPDNQGAWRLGEALRIASKAGGGDYIDTGLGLLKQLELKGYGVYELDEAGAPQMEPAHNPEHTLFNEIRTSTPVSEDGEPVRYIITEQQLQCIYGLENTRRIHLEMVSVYAKGCQEIIEGLRAALRSCAKASSAAEVGLIVDGAIAANQAQRALALENQRVVPAEPLLAPRHPFDLLAADHKGMRVDYSGLLKQAVSALRRGVKEPGLAELLRQLQEHMTELGRRWYSGDTAVVDELLQLYAVEDAARDALKKAQGGDK